MTSNWAPWTNTPRTAHELRLQLFVITSLLVLSAVPATADDFDKQAKRLSCEDWPAVQRAAAAIRSMGKMARIRLEQLVLPPSPPDSKGLRLLIKQLADPQFRIREKASAGLLKLGPCSFRLLLRASEDDDMERATRASSVLRQLQKKPGKKRKRRAIEAALLLASVGSLESIPVLKFPLTSATRRPRSLLRSRFERSWLMDQLPAPIHGSSIRKGSERCGQASSRSHGGRSKLKT